MRQDQLDQLRSEVSNNTDWYKKSEPWLNHYFGDDEWHAPSNHVIGSIKLVAPEGRRVHADLENTKKIYDALKTLKISEATDERLWTYLAHVTFWKYMRLRWPIENIQSKDPSKSKDPSNFIKERYFIQRSNRDRGLIRHGISRLWWYGFVSYDKDRNDPYELTRVLLTKQDITQNLLERSFSRNPKVTRTVLSVLAEMERSNRPFYRRKKFRDLMMYVNHLGGVTVLDALDEADIESLLIKKIEKLT